MVVPICIRHSLCHQVPEFIVQTDHHASHPGLSWVLHTVPVRVEPDPVAHTGWLHIQGDAQIPGRVVFSSLQIRHDSLSAQRVHVAVCPIVCPCILRTHRVRRMRHKLHRIVTWHQVLETVVAVRIGARLGHRRPCCAVQLNDDARHACFPGILHPIFVCVVPDPIPQTRRWLLCVDAQIPGRVVLLGDQVGQHCLSGVRVCVAVCGSVAADSLWADAVLGRRHESDVVVSWRQVVKTVVADSVGHRFCHQRACCIVQLHHHTHYTALVVILNPVLVRVVPDPIPQAGWFHSQIDP